MQVQVQKEKYRYRYSPTNLIYKSPYLLQSHFVYGDRIYLSQAFTGGTSQPSIVPPVYQCVCVSLCLCVDTVSGK